MEHVSSNSEEKIPEGFVLVGDECEPLRVLERLEERGIRVGDEIPIRPWMYR